jgi:hypothetical protein
MDYITLDTQFPLTGPGDRSTDRLHLSDIYTDLERTLFPKTTSADMTNQLWAETGFLWETLLSRVLAEHCGARPGEVELDGIVGSPDGFDPSTGVLDEYKSTWKSITKTHPSNVWKWMTQVKGYCKMLGVLVVRFHVFYINGDYRGSGPLYRSYLFSFTQREVNENWAMLINHAKLRGWLT